MRRVIVTFNNRQDILIAREVTILDHISLLFEVRLDAIGRDDIEPADLIGKTMDINIEIGSCPNSGQLQYRYFSGIVTQMHNRLRDRLDYRAYFLTIRPAFWLLTQHIDYRIWQDKTAIEVLQTLLLEHGQPAADVSGVVDPPEPIPYSVQYGESDFAYVLRRMEDAGLFWWSSHNTHSQVIHVANDASGWRQPAVEAHRRVLIREAASADTSIHKWRKIYSYIPESWYGRDWNFETPNICVEAKTPSLIPLNNNAHGGIYAYPSGGTTIEAAEHVGKLRMQAIEAGYYQIEGCSDVRSLETGCRFQPYESNADGESDDEYVITSITHKIVISTGHSLERGNAYSNEFRALPARLPLTPTQTMRAPKIHGMQIGIVAAPPGEEIYTDEYGRVKLHFPWDRRAKKDGSDTCWIRVSQPWSGENAGIQSIPRAGTEVLVTFLDENPDRPLIIGTLSNPLQMPAYELPFNKTRTVLRSNTHKGSGFNEVYFEDEAGKENQFFHAQKDRTERILNNSTKRVDAAYLKSIGTNCALEIFGCLKNEIGGSYNLTVGGVQSNARAIATKMAELAHQTARLLQKANGLGGGDTDVEGFSSSISSGSLGFFDEQGMQALKSLAKAQELGRDMGEEFAASGEKISQAVNRMFSSYGIMNTVVGAYRSDTVGHSTVEQVGKLKVINVGAVSIENVEKIKHTIVGETLTFEVGKAQIRLEANGNIVIAGSSLDIDFSGDIKLKGRTIHLN